MTTVQTMKDVILKTRRRTAVQACAQRIGKMLRERRQMADMSLDDAAQELGMSLQQVSKFESGESLIAAAYLSALAKAYGCNEGDFYPHTDDQHDGKMFSSAVISATKNLAALPGQMQDDIADFISKLRKHQEGPTS